MSVNQLHGKRFEDFIKGCGLFPGASDQSRSVTAGFDIEAKFDRSKGLATSIKASGNDTIGLSDARRFFSVIQPYRMIVGRYRQSGGQKVFAEVHECILSQEAIVTLHGAMTLEIVTDFHEGLLLNNFPQDQHLAARAWAQDRKAALAQVETKIILNPKIDSKSQRRLQCSVHLGDLIEVSKAFDSYHLHDQSIGDFGLPIIQNSARRIFQTKLTP
ncbi:MAG: hypothetical protein HC843_06010 [Sphingomonadales bacterium]|nr:hypothetical protein [Sphingomonadales bacterium]